MVCRNLRALASYPTVGAVPADTREGPIAKTFTRLHPNGHHPVSWWCRAYCRTAMPQQLPLLFSNVASLSAFIFGGAGLGGGIYETLLIDPRWPANPAIIQPSRGGINRGFFWGPVHTLYELALIVSVWSAWKNEQVRWWILGALGTHLAARAWSFAYFIPNALRFEQVNDFSEKQTHLARRWTRLSRCRPVIQAVSLIALGGAILCLRTAC